MAALNRPVTATYAVQESVRIDTQDHEDHTFCGIMFPVRAKAVLPVERLVISSVAVRGQLGKMTVWVTNDLQPNDEGNYSFPLSKRRWTKVYERKHEPSRRVYATLDFTNTPILLEPGQVRMIYVHSTEPSDEAIVYDQSDLNPRTRGYNNNASASSGIRYQDDKIAIHSGKAHLSPKAFGQTPIWGWGNAWRDRREFVGQVQYGTVYKLWSPERHLVFGGAFDAATMALLAAQRRDESPLATLPDECIYYILNMCKWDWFDDDYANVRRRVRSFQATRNRRVEQEQAAIAVAAVVANGAADTDMAVMEDNAANDVQADDSDDEDFEPDEDDEEQDDDEDDDDGEDDDDDSDAYEHADYRADTSRFEFRNVQSDDDSMDDDDDDDDAAGNGTANNAHHHHGYHWRPLFGQGIARQLVLRALGGGESNRVVVDAGSDDMDE